ncbi:MAG: cytochrome c peroxidase [Gammaproteobacteria bacterium]|nr:cytochrome c peroxidase [Gammaproteobacteria bacterium]
MLFDGRVSLLEEKGEHDGPLYRTPESTLRSSPDGKAVGDLLAVQARFPVVSFQEMRGFGEFYELTAAEVRRRIAERLRQHEGWLNTFRLAFRAPDATAEEIVTFDNIAAALSEFQHSQTFVDTPWRDYVKGYPDSLTEKEKAGAVLFFADAGQGGYGCAACHSGDFFTDENRHVAGLPQLGRGKRADGDDPGAFLVTQEQEDLYRFRTPSLLNVEVTGPWGHSGAFSSLEALVRYHANPQAGIDRFDFSLSHLDQLALADGAYEQARALTAKAVERASDALPHRSPGEEEVEQLVAFLEALTDPCVESRDCLQPWIANYTDDLRWPDVAALVRSIR